MSSRAAASHNGVWQFSSAQPTHRHPSHADNKGAPTAPKKFKFEPRFQVVIACFLATLTMYVERVGFSIAYTAMAKEAAVDEATKGTVLSAFYWGYGLSQVRPSCGVALCSLAAGRGGRDGSMLPLLLPSWLPRSASIAVCTCCRASGGLASSFIWLIALWGAVSPRSLLLKGPAVLRSAATAPAQVTQRPWLSHWARILPLSFAPDSAQESARLHRCQAAGRRNTTAATECCRPPSSAGPSPPSSPPARPATAGPSSRRGC
jgi:hypothetical protein